MLYIIGTCVACAVLGALTLGAGATGHVAACAYPSQFRVIPEARTWQIDCVLFAGSATDLTVASVAVDGADVTGAVVASVPPLRATPRGECVSIAIPVDRLASPPVNGRDYSVAVELRGHGRVVRFTTLATVRSLPTDPDWSPAELHIHSRASDGARHPRDLVRPLRNLGFRIVYFTDHVDRAAKRFRAWEDYAAYITGATAAERDIRFYPGNEFTVVDDAGRPQGDMVAYGIAGYCGLENRRHSPQEAIDDVLANNPSGPSSPTIPHPFGAPAWADWDVARYRGYEVMGGCDRAVYSDCGPAPDRWRAELLKQTETAWFASARAGGDWHQSILDPDHPGYVTWINTGRWFSKPDVDAALYGGRTVASRKGSLAYMSMACGTELAGIGGRLAGLPAGAPVHLRITFKPVASCSYSITVYRDDKAEAVFERGEAPYEALQTYVLTGSFAAAAGSHYYYLFVRSHGDVTGEEYVYASPVFVLAGAAFSSNCPVQP